MKINLAEMKINLAQMKFNLAQMIFNLAQMRFNLAQIKFNLVQMKINLAQMIFNLTLMTHISCFLLAIFTFWHNFQKIFLKILIIYIVLLITNNINMYIYSDPIGDPIFRPNIMET